eukprot:TRINITY_DN24027_c0_g2_i1.p1 TRINITY_DN24027_c0_g2~~TRINITY_DN24027_c0_g2_i1.p1  ORF type:complete len:1000 (-),score=191.91 TRINITY_DN24027_c0_g2_i1:42-3041(-)
MASNPQSPASDVGSWQAMLDATVPAVVALSVTAVRGFQDDTAGAQGGTGFVVDAKQGLLLTNRHVCTCGPERASAAFVGCPAAEEVKVSIAYLDPVHDFAFLRFDPKELHNTPLTEIELDPSGCRVGEEIRVVGNDSLEKLQILSATIARIDRNPPELASDYNDENTFYVLAASGTRGGSSGSPILNQQGRAVALNAAATNGTMHAFYFPLHRVVRALEAVRAGCSVPRGTICTSFHYTSFPECMRLGVEKSFVNDVIHGDLPLGGTFTKGSPPGGLLQVQKCIPGTEASELLKAGDLLLKVGGKQCSDFILLDTAIDDAVGGSVQLTILRGGEELQIDLRVRDLHCLIPHAFFEVGLGVFHEVPYQTAQKNNVPLQGVYVASAGAIFGQALKSDVVIQEINGSPCLSLHSFEVAVQQIPDKEYFHVVWTTPSNGQERRRCEAAVKMQRQWGVFRAWERDAKTRRWTPRQPIQLDVPASQEQEAPMTKTPKRRRSSSASSPAKPHTPKRARTASAALEGSICQVTFRILQHFEFDVVSNGENLDGDLFCCRGAGVVIDAEAGLVLTDRATVPQFLGDVEVMLGDETRSASVWYIHPTHSLVVLRVDGCAGPSGKPFGVPAAFSDRHLEEGEELDFVGVENQGRRLSAKFHVQDVRLGNFPTSWPPRWQERSLEVVVIADAPGEAQSGALCNGLGQICAWYTFATLAEDQRIHRLGYGLPAHAILPLLQQVKSAKAMKNAAQPRKLPTVLSLEVKFQATQLSNLRRLPPKLRPSEEWFAKLAALSPNGPSGCKALLIEGITSQGPCDGVVCEGDLLVAVCGEVVTTVRAVEAKLETLRRKMKSGLQKVPLTVLRRGQELEVVVTVPLLSSDGARRVLGWHGLVLQNTPRAAREAGPVPAEWGIHICQTMLGSPAEAYGIEGDFLISVDGKATTNLDDLLAVGRTASQEQRYLRIESADATGRRFLKTLEPDALFWPTFEMRRDDASGAWSYHELGRLPVQ